MGADAADILMVADGCAEFALAMGVEMDLTEKGMGIRSRRYSMVVDKLEVRQLPACLSHRTAAHPAHRRARERRRRSLGSLPLLPLGSAEAL